MTAADAALVAGAEQWGDELDPTPVHGRVVRVRLFSGLTGSTATGRLVVDEDGQLVVEVHDVQPAAQVRTFGGAA